MKLVDLLDKLYRRSLPKEKQVCLYYWRPSHRRNFGDELSWHIVQRLLKNITGSAKPLVHYHKHRRYQCRLFAIGSILHACRSGDVVWGSGINGKRSAYGYDFSKVQFRAVRGPLTRRMVMKHGGHCPERYGDPALLVSMLFPEIFAATEFSAPFRVSYIPNINDMVLLEEQDTRDVHVIAPTSDWRQVATSIASSEFVISSSLHGIILADAAGVNCRPLTSLFESPFKFEDYFYATNRENITYARSIKEALDLGPIPKHNPDLEGLMRAFPVDLFC